MGIVAHQKQAGAMGQRGMCSAQAALKTRLARAFRGRGTSDLGENWTATEPVNDGKEMRAIQPSIAIFIPPENFRRRWADGRGKIFEPLVRGRRQDLGEMTLTTLPNPNSELTR